MHGVVSPETRLDSNISHTRPQRVTERRRIPPLLWFYTLKDSLAIEVTLISGQNTHLELKNKHIWTSPSKEHRNEFLIISHSGSMSNQYSH